MPTLPHPHRPLKWTARGVVAGGIVFGLLGTLGGCSSGEKKPEGGTPVVTADPKVELAEQKLREGDKASALAILEEVIRENPKATRAQMNVADIRRSDGDYHGAAQAYEAAGASDPQNFDAFYNAGLMRHVLKQLSEAITDYLKALRLKPHDFQTNANIATAYYQYGENAQARPFAEEAVRLNPRDGGARYTLGAVYAALDMNDLALVEFQQATELYTDFQAPLLLALGETYGKLGRYTEMRNTLQTLAKNKPSPEAWERLGYALFKLKDYGSALEAFNNALAMDPNYFPALNGIGVCELNEFVWSERTDTAAKDRALRALRRSYQINSDQPRIAELLSRYR